MIGNASVFYCELRRDLSEIRDALVEDGKMKDLFLDECALIVKFADIVKKQGFLELESYILKLEESGNDINADLKRMIKMVIDGTDPLLIEDIQMKRYFSAGMSEYEGFMFLVYLDSALYIQQAVPKYVIEENLKSYMPDKLWEEFENMMENT